MDPYFLLNLTIVLPNKTSLCKNFRSIGLLLMHQTYCDLQINVTCYSCKKKFPAFFADINFRELRIEETFLKFRNMNLKCGHIAFHVYSKVVGVPL